MSAGGLPEAQLTPPTPSRSPWQRLYAEVLAKRRRRGGTERLPATTWSVGNLHWGGGGKTPLVAEIATSLIALGARVCVLSRGYGRRDHQPRLVSRGEGPLHPAEIAGDEPHSLARTVPGLLVAVAPQRYQAGLLALRELATKPDLFLLDDGFSHVRLARDLDILAFPSSDPFGGARLLPSGRLREPLQACRHADAAMLTGVAGSSPDLRALGEQLEASLAPFGFGGVGFAATLDATVASATEREPPRKVVLVSGVARPSAVHATATACGVEVVEHLRFADHHTFPPRSLRKIERALERSPGSSLLATSKDWGKLAHRLDAPLAELRVHCQPSQGFRSWLAERLESQRKR